MNEGLTYPTPYGEGSISYSQAQGYWRGELFFGKNKEGKPVKKIIYGHDPNDVKAKLDSIREEIKYGRLSLPSKITAREIYLESLAKRLALNSMKENTCERHKNEIYAMMPLIDMPVQKIDFHMLNAFFEQKRHVFSQSVLKKAYYAFGYIFRDALEANIIKTNPMVGLDLPKSTVPVRVIRALTIDEEVRFIEILNEMRSRYKPQFLISLYTGMRCGEINALTLSDINLRHGYINVNKTIASNGGNIHTISPTTKTPAGNRQIPINSIVRPVIEEVVRNCSKNRHELIFENRYGGLVYSSQPNAMIRYMCNKYHFVDSSIEGRITFHSLRHTYATRCIESGMDAMILKNLMGHKTIDMTLDTYSDVFDKYEKDNIYKIENHLLSLGIDITSRL